MIQEKMQYKNLKMKAYDIIKDKIINCKYLPNEFINESILIQEIGSSRTPIREALNKLEQENLVHIIPKKGIMISDLSINEINIIYETRSLIEPYIIRNYLANIDKTSLKNFRDWFADIGLNSLKEIYEMDDIFHKFINQASNNKYFLSILEQVNIQNQRVRILSSYSKDRIIESQQEHLNIIDAILSEDVKKSEEYMCLHLENAKNTAFKFLIDNGGWKVDN